MTAGDSVHAIAAATTPRSRSVKVLLADGDPRLLARYAEILAGAGYQVETAEEGEAVRRKLDATDFDVVVSDVALPAMDGMALLSEVKAKFPDLPVVLMTGTPELESAIQAHENGALKYLVKPFSDQAICEIVLKGARLNHLARLKRASLATLGTGDFRPGDFTSLDFGFTRALESLWMAYQPVLDRKGRLFGYEALVRTQEPTLPTPLDLFASAERLGRLHELGRLIRQRVAETMAEAPAQPTFLVNLHAYDLFDDLLFAADAPLSWHSSRVILEITERSSLEGIPLLPTKIAALRRMGFRIAIDDLGAGYAGLTSLARLEPDAVKLDMSLVRNVDAEPMKKNLIRSMTRVCKEMRMLVVAEGIETSAEYETVKQLGCGLFQGYLLGKPERFPPKP